MKVEPLEEVQRKIIKLYNKNPEGWRILTDKKGNIIVLGPRTNYRLKLISINPQQYTGIGLKIEQIKKTRNIGKEFPSYGFRPLSRKDAQELLRSILRKSNLQKELINKLFDIKPMSTRGLEHENPDIILGGPILVHPDLSTISKKQRELEAKLASEADKLFRKKYPSRAKIYY